MSMTPERVAERVDELIESIRHGTSHDFAHHNAAQTISYIRQVHELEIIDIDQFNALVAAVVVAAKDWQPQLDWNGYRSTRSKDMSEQYDSTASYDLIDAEDIKVGEVRQGKYYEGTWEAGRIEDGVFYYEAGATGLVEGLIVTRDDKPGQLTRFRLVPQKTA